MAKFKTCEDGKHGACESSIPLEELDPETGEVVYTDIITCACWCHNNEARNK